MVTGQTVVGASGREWDAAGSYSGGVEQGGRDCRRRYGVWGFSSRPKPFVIPRDLHHLDVRHFLHGEYLVAPPICAGYFFRVEGDFFFQSFAQTHDDATVHTSVKLAGIDDLAAFDTDGEVCHLYGSRCRSHQYFGDAYPIRVFANNDGNASAR